MSFILQINYNDNTKFIVKAKTTKQTNVQITVYSTKHINNNNNNIRAQRKTKKNKKKNL